MPDTSMPGRKRGRWAAVVCVALAVAGCSAGDPPNPDEAQVTPLPSPAPGSVQPPATPNDSAVDEDDEDHASEPELSDADDATLDALEERFEDQGVKDIRGTPGEGVTIRLEDELTVADAAAVCEAVRTAGFAQVQVDIGGNVAACP